MVFLTRAAAVSPSAVLAVIICSWAVVMADWTSLVSKCQSSVITVASCLPYVSVGGSLSNVSPVCCGAVTDLYNTKEVCLCVFAEEVYTNSSDTAGYNINVDSLIALPSACNIQSSDPAKCIGLLGLNSSSPRAAVFLSPPPGSLPSTPGLLPTPPPALMTTDEASNGYRALSMEGLIMQLAVTFFLYVFRMVAL